MGALEKSQGRGLLKRTQEERAMLQVKRLENKIAKKQKKREYLAQIAKKAGEEERKLEGKLRGLQMNSLTRKYDQLVEAGTQITEPSSMPLGEKRLIIFCIVFF